MLIKKNVLLICCLYFFLSCISNKESKKIDATLDEISSCIDTNYTKAGNLMRELQRDSAKLSESQKMYFRALNINYSDKKNKITMPLTCTEIG